MGSYNQGFLQTEVLTTRDLKTRGSYSKGSFNQGFLLPRVLQPGVLTLIGSFKKSVSNPGFLTTTSLLTRGFKEYVKYLGVMIDNHLSWKHHINYVALKISRNIGILSKLRHFVPPKTLFGIYNSLIFPYLSYGLVAWGQAAKVHLEKLLTLQKRAVRLINFAPFRSHAVPYFLHSNIMPITMLYFKLSSMLMFDVYNNTAPHNISHLFIPTQQIHSYSTRSSSSGNYYISHSRLNQKNDSFSIMGAKIWNSIPENLRNSSRSLFKEKVHTILLKIFEVQDRYADLNTIISDFKKY